MEPRVRPLFGIVLILSLSACSGIFAGVPPASDLAMGAGALGLMYSDDIANASADDISLKDAVPPQAKSTTTRIADGIRDNVHATGRHLKDWWNYDPNAHVATRQPVPNSYCYRAQTDVTCYRAPMPGWENRLVGYQGTFAEAPQPVMMQPLPAKSVDTNMLPATRVAKAQPVFVEMPPEVKQEPKDPTQLLEADPQNAHETIADPTLSPQL
jgi:hypothetical protein